MKAKTRLQTLSPVKEAQLLARLARVNARHQRAMERWLEQPTHEFNPDIRLPDFWCHVWDQLAVYIAEAFEDACACGCTWSRPCMLRTIFADRRRKGYRRWQKRKNSQYTPFPGG